MTHIQWLISESNKAYTVGSTRDYDELLASEPLVEKSGQNDIDGYPGGWVWRDRWAAGEFAAILSSESDLAHSVYVIELPNGWEEDTYLPVGQSVHSLRTNAKIIRKD